MRKECLKCWNFLLGESGSGTLSLFQGLQRRTYNSNSGSPSADRRATSHHDTLACVCSKIDQTSVFVIATTVKRRSHAMHRWIETVSFSDCTPPTLIWSRVVSSECTNWGKKSATQKKDTEISQGWLSIQITSPINPILKSPGVLIQGSLFSFIDLAVSDQSFLLSLNKLNTYHLFKPAGS